MDNSSRAKAARIAAQRVKSTPGQVRKISDMVSLGYSDEFDARSAQLEIAAQNLLSRTGLVRHSGMDPRDFHDAVLKAEAQARARFAREHPTQEKVLTVVGALMTPGAARLGKWVQGGRTAGGKVLRSVTAGASLGAVSGAGGAERGQRTEGAVRGAAAGAVVGAVLPPVAQVVEKAAAPVVGALRTHAAKVDPLVERVEAFIQAASKPSLAATAGPVARRATEMTAAMPLAGMPTRALLRNSLKETDQAAARVAESYGAPLPAATAGERVAGGVDGAATYDLILRSARSGAPEDIARLQALKNAAPPPAWNDLAATMAWRLGRPNADAADAAADVFSANSLSANYAALSDEGRNLLFGGPGGAMRDRLDNLAQVAGMQKAIEPLTAPNHSVSDAIAWPAVALADWKSAVGLPVAVSATGAALAHPAVAQWTARLAQARRNGAGALADEIEMLARAAQDDRALLPLLQTARAYSPEAASPGR